MLELSFREDVKFTVPSENGGLRLEGQQFVWTPKKLPAGIKAAFERLSQGATSENELVEQVSTLDGSTGVIHLYQYLNRLSRLICYSLKWNDELLATLVPHEPPSDYQFEEKLIDPEQQYLLSRFAALRRTREGELVVESPLGRAKIVLHHPLGSTLFGTLSTPQFPDQLMGILPNLPASISRAFANLLLNANLICAVDGDGHTQEDTISTLGQWEYADLLFHKETRMGWKDQPYGGNYRFQEKFSPLPVAKPDLPDNIIPLVEPDIETLKQIDVPFTAVLEKRRSNRKYSERPISVEELGEFLYRTARITQLIDMGPDDAQLAFRPYPSGGALHELEIYPVVNQCEGIERGLYYYNPLEHQLHHLSGGTPQVNNMLTYAWMAGNRESQPQLLLTITARFQRIQWKYQSLPYALIMKHVGVLMQTMYLVATAMGLAPCAIGGGNSDLFSQAAKLDYYAETSVGEFLLGRPA